MDIPLKDKNPINNMANCHLHSRGYPDAQTIKNLPAMQETKLQSLCQDSLEKGMATHSSILAWRMPWTEESGGLQSIGLQRVRHDWVTNTLYHLHGWKHLHFMDFFVVLFVSLLKTAGTSSNEQHNSIMYKPFCPYRHKFILPLEICRF